LRPGCRARGEGGQWRIDDIRGADGGEPWSVRAMLTEALKN
jgi:hypothetical protein